MAALLFALHPASHEAVYWIAARFDLLATFFILVALACLIRPGLKWQLAGTLAFGFALMSKESAISLVIIAPAWDALIARRDWRTTARRLMPLLAVVAVYAAARTLGADLDAAGGARRLPKVLMTGVGVAGVLWLSRAQQSKTRGAAASGTVAMIVRRERRRAGSNARCRGSGRLGLREDWLHRPRVIPQPEPSGIPGATFGVVFAHVPSSVPPRHSDRSCAGGSRVARVAAGMGCRRQRTDLHRSLRPGGAASRVIDDGWPSISLPSWCRCGTACGRGALAGAEGRTHFRARGGRPDPRGFHPADPSCRASLARCLDHDPRRRVDDGALHRLLR